MNFSKHTLLAALAAGTMAVGSANAATTLDFSGLGGNSSGMPDTYGDNLAGTPNIDITWNTAGDATSADGWDSYNSWNGRGEVGQTDYGQANPLDVTFTADAGFGVFVTSFDVDEYAGGGDTVVNWELVGTGFSGSVTDFNTTNDAGDAGGRVTVNTGMTSGDAVTTPLILRLELASGASSYQAIDNLSFDQITVPEPGSAALALGGLGLLAMRRKRK